MATSNDGIDDLLSYVRALAFEADPRVGRPIRVAGSVESILGLSAEDAIEGRFRLESIVLAEDLPLLVDFRREQGAAHLKEYRYRRPDHTVGWMLDVTRMFEGDGGLRIAGLLIDITDQRRSEATAGISLRQLRESLDRLDLLAVALDLQGRVTFCNARLLERTEYQENEVIGSDWFALFVPLDLRSVRDTFEQGISGGAIPQHFENEIVTRRGERLTVHWTNTVIEDLEGEVVGTYSIGQDVTAMRRATAALAASEARYRQLFETMQDGLVLLDVAPGLPEGDHDCLSRDCRFVEVNPAFERMVRRSAQSLLAGSVREVFSTVYEPLLERLGQVATTGTASQFELSWPEMHRELEITAFRPAVGRVAAVVVDATERKRLQVQLQQASKLESIGRLAGGIAHDFNNLLTAILGGAQLALMHLPEEHPARAELDGVVRASERAGRLTAQLLAYARKRFIQLRTVHLGELVAASRDMLRRLISENVALVTHVASDLWPVRADLGQLEQVMLNLVLNARDSMPHGGTLRLELGNVALDASYAVTHPDVAPGEYVAMAVSDTGVGMSRAIQSRVFEPFFTTKGNVGTGLGLATCEGIVKQHGGHIQLYSEPGRGSTFKVYLPRSRAVDPPLPEATQTSTLQGYETLLVVEDEPLVLEVARKTLRACGYHVLAAETAEQALALAHEFRGEIHALITDVVMPGMNGGELAARLNEQRPKVRVLYVSGYTENTIADRGVVDPQVMFLEKPYTPDQLAGKVRDVLQASSL